VRDFQRLNELGDSAQEHTFEIRTDNLQTGLKDVADTAELEKPSKYIG
jgi:hypothetical protein